MWNSKVRLLLAANWRLLIVVFFSSRRRHTICYRDWSSDVCSSDLMIRRPPRATVTGVQTCALPIIRDATVTGVQTCALPIFPDGPVSRYVDLSGDPDGKGLAD